MGFARSFLPRTAVAVVTEQEVPARREETSPPQEKPPEENEWTRRSRELEQEMKRMQEELEFPELNQDENGIVEGPKKYVFDITKRWMDPDNDGKTGYHYIPPLY